MGSSRIAVAAAVAACAALAACSSDAPPRRDPPARWTPIDATIRTPAVIVTGIRPPLGPAGQWVYVFGSGFVPGQTAVTVGGHDAVGNVYDSSQLGFTVPAEATGSTPVTVTVPAGSATSAQLYTVDIPHEPPTIVALSPDSGPPGTWVVATGTNFVFGQTTIVVDGHPTPGGVYEPETLWFTVPDGVTRSGAVTVRTPNGTANSVVPFRLITAERPPELEHP